MPPAAVARIGQGFTRRRVPRSTSPPARSSVPLQPRGLGLLGLHLAVTLGNACSDSNLRKLANASGLPKMERCLVVHSARPM